MLIFEAPSAELGVYPSDESQPHARAGTNAISSLFDEIAATVAELRAKGFEFTALIEDYGLRLGGVLKNPGGETCSFISRT